MLINFLLIEFYSKQYAFWVLAPCHFHKNNPEIARSVHADRSLSIESYNWLPLFFFNHFFKNSVDQTQATRHRFNLTKTCLIHHLLFGKIIVLTIIWFTSALPQSKCLTWHQHDSIRWDNIHKFHGMSICA